MSLFPRKPYSATAEWTSASGDRTSELLHEAVRRLGGRITSDKDNSLEVLLGSRTSLRMFGLARGTSDLPMKISITWSDNTAESRVRIVATSDEGFYLVRLPALKGYYVS